MADGSVTAGVKSPVRVRYHRRNQNNTRFPLNRLPFINRKDGNCWALPPSSGYGTGCDMGAAAADAFMKALRASDGVSGSQLQQLVLSLLETGIDPKDSGRRGQVVGFFSQLDGWLRAASKSFGYSLDSISEADIERRMTLAAIESEEAHAARYEAHLRAKYPDLLADEED